MAIISRTKVTLRVSGESLDPENITNSLGGHPTLSRKKEILFMVKMAMNGYQNLVNGIYQQWMLNQEI